MNNQDEEKAGRIAEKLCRFYGKEYDSFKECKESALEMAAWKEQQMIEKATLWLTKNLEKYGCFNCFIEDHKIEPDIIRDFKQAMRED